MSRYEVDFRHQEKLADAMAKVPAKSEQVINEHYKTTGAKEVIQNIVGFIPVGKRPNAKGKGSTPHAKNSNPLNKTLFNLGFEVYAKGGAANSPGSWGYLVFPNEGRGPRNHWAQEFFERGSDKSEEKIFKDIIDALEKAHDI